ncbi:MAG: ABC transporter [Planctomycetes bacterium DG_58]|nr:MAG: ABC transporter [Planctomycetes bacterium DG_58]KPL04319.1 MAG: ABC transporter [Planctomycetes bacterium SM23_65]
MTGDALISLEDVHKTLDGLQVLRGVVLNVNAGETLCVLGESGCGKSVLLKHVIGLMHPDRGRVLFDGMDLARLSAKEMVPVRTHFGMVFQGGALFDSLTVGENVAFPLRRHTDLDEKAIQKRVHEKLSLVGLAGAEEKRPAELSGGMQKRVALARAIALEPQVVLYDEPTTGLDPIMADVINELIIRAHDALKTTSIVVTHDMVSAYKVSDRIAMLHEGRIIIDGTPEEIQNTDNVIVRQFIEGRAGDRIEKLSQVGENP